MNQLIIIYLIIVTGKPKNNKKLYIYYIYIQLLNVDIKLKDYRSRNIYYRDKEGSLSAICIDGQQESYRGNNWMIGECGEGQSSEWCGTGLGNSFGIKKKENTFYIKQLEKVGTEQNQKLSYNKCRFRF